MKTLIIVAIILGVAFIFFVARAEKSFIINGNEVIPASLTNIPKMLLNKAGEIKSRILDNGGTGNLINLEPNSTGNIISEAKDFISGAINKITATIKAPIEDKISEILCPQK